MSAIIYMWRCTIKNYFKTALKKPAVLIPYIVLAALLVLSFASMSIIHTIGERKIAQYSAILFGFYMLIAVISIFSGTKRGANIFSMADVNYIFTSPIAPDKALISGVLKQSAILFLASLFLIMQYPNMRNMLGLDVLALIGLMLSYFLLGLNTNILAALLYSFCSKSPSRRQLVTRGMTACIAVIVVIAVLAGKNSNDITGALLNVFGSRLWHIFPIVGWSSGLAASLADYDFLMAALFLALSIGTTLALTRLLRRSDMDFFEDVLIAAELHQQLKQSANNSKGFVSTAEVRSNAKRVSGTLRGSGASAIVYRIFREQSRSKAWLLDTSSATAAGAPLLCMVFVGSVSFADVGLWPLISMTAWLLLVAGMKSKFTKELSDHVLYMIPAKPFAKLLAIFCPELIKIALDAAIFTAVSIVLLKLSINYIITLFFIYTSISALITASQVPIDRLFGSFQNKIINRLIYMLIIVLFILPGILLAFVIDFAAPYINFIIWNFAVTLLLLFLFRNILVNNDLQ